LQLASVTSTVNVTAEDTVVDLVASTVNRTVDGATIRELPLNGRDWVQLATLEPGVAAISYGGSGGRNGNGAKLTVSGARPSENNFRMDGVSINDNSNSTPGNMLGTNLGVESIREFSIVSNSYSAEYGRSTGAVVNAVTKSGANAIHGDVFFFHRNSALDARNHFDGPGKIPPFRRHQFGGSLGGPVVRNRTFFFANYEGLRQQLGTTTIYNVPTDAARRGDVAGDRIAVNPAVQPYLALYPQPNGRDFGDGTAEYSTAINRGTDEDFVSARLDQQLSADHSVFVRYTYSNARDNVPADLALFEEIGESKSQFLTAEYKSVLSPRLLNVARVGFTRHNLRNIEESLVDISPSLSLQEGTPMPRLAVSGLTQLGSSDLLPQAFNDTTYELYDSLAYTRGRHSVKAGGQVQFIQNNAESNTRQASRWNFASLEAFLEGRASRVQISPRELADPIRQFRQTFVAAFFQDDIRLGDRLTLNAGLRAEWAGTITETEGRLALMPIDRFASGTVDDIRTGDPWYDNAGVTLGPRVGVAWDAFGNGRTAVCAGYGLFHDHIWSWWISGTGAYRMAPFYSTFDLRETLSFPMTAAQFVELLRERQGRDVPAGNQVFQPDPDPRQQKVHQFGADIQHQLAGNLVVKLGYKGSRGVDLARNVDLNTAAPLRVEDGVPIFSSRPAAPNPGYGTMLVMTTDSQSFYNALLAEVSKRFGSGLHFQASYTFSKLIDEASGIRTSGDGIDGAGAGTVLSYRFRTLDRGLSTFHVAHNFVANLGVDLPFGDGVVLGGWQVNTILTLSSGNPATLAQGTNARTSLISGSRRPDLVEGGDNNPVLGGPDQYFDVSHFEPSDPARFGTVGRNTLIGPGFANLDLSLVKTIPVRAMSEGARLSVRAEVFNLFNRANFSLPDMEVFNASGRLQGSAGRITRTAAPARQVQLGLRLDW
jgi:hypothetical protein